MTQPLNRMRQNEKNRHKNHPCKRALSLVTSPTLADSLAVDMHTWRFQRIFGAFLILRAVYMSLGVSFFATGPGLGLIIYILTTLEFSENITMTSMQLTELSRFIDILLWFENLS